jgi:glycosyltransferase involved in cell wall biosynthesis
VKKYHILFDLISTQGYINGGAEFTLKTLQIILEKYDLERHQLFFLYDSKIPIVYQRASPEFLEKELHFKCIDIAREKSIGQIISQYNIDVFFVGIGQRLAKYTFQDIQCRTLLIFHDLSNIEIHHYGFEYILRSKSAFKLFKLFIRDKLNAVLKFSNKKKMEQLFTFSANKNIEIYTSSEYSKDSLTYFFPIIKSPISVMYCPEKIIENDPIISNSKLKEIIDSKVDYFIILAADRIFKNAKFALAVFEKFANENPNFYLLTIGFEKKEFQNHLTLPYLSSSDLDHAIKNSYSLIFPTLFEGFGYPPIEAMKYGKPILCSNVCSMPEILGDAPIYFSPFYQVDLFRALKRVMEEYPSRSEKSRLRYQIIKDKQLATLEMLVHSILNN